MKMKRHTKHIQVCKQCAFELKYACNNFHMFMTERRPHWHEYKETESCPICGNWIGVSPINYRIQYTTKQRVAGHTVYYK